MLHYTSEPASTGGSKKPTDTSLTDTSFRGVEIFHTVKTFDVAMFECEGYRRAAEYWDQVRGDQLLPCRADIKLSEYPELAMNGTILNHRKDCELRVCFTSIQSIQRMEMEVTGLDLFDLYPPHLIPVINSWIKSALAVPCAYTFLYSGEMPNGRQVSHKSLSLPLMDRDGVTRYILVIVQSDVEDMGAHFGEFLEHVSRLRVQPIDIGAGCPDPIDVTAEREYGDSLLTTPMIAAIL